MDFFKPDWEQSLGIIFVKYIFIGDELVIYNNNNK